MKLPGNCSEEFWFSEDVSFWAQRGVPGVDVTCDVGAALVRYQSV